eukprot:11680207-Alexandrium_andersonii.AAC.1
METAAPKPARSTTRQDSSEPQHEHRQRAHATATPQPQHKRGASTLQPQHRRGAAKRNHSTGTARPRRSRNQ